MKLIKLRGKYAVGSHAFAIVDDEDYERLSRYAWKAKPNGFNNNTYAVRNIKTDGGCSTLRMHREVVKAIKGDGFDVHHINHNSLDNRRSNLQIVTRSENMKEIRLKIYSGICAYCNKPFDKEVKANVYNIPYCSKECQKIATYKPKQPKVPKEYNRTCKQCNHQYITKDARQVYCSDECRYKFRNNKHIKMHERKCKHCGKEFQTNKSYMIFCCKQHERRWRSGKGYSKRS